VLPLKTDVLPQTVEELTIITIDENIQKYDVPWIW
jgi:hypothetical protein